jgi:hypothetical protein
VAGIFNSEDTGARLRRAARMKHGSRMFLWQILIKRARVFVTLRFCTRRQERRPGFLLSRFVQPGIGARRRAGAEEQIGLLPPRTGRRGATPIRCYSLLNSLF